MRRYNIDDPFIRWVQQLYADATCKVMLNGYFTDSLLLRCGVRQGCPLSPLLYVLIIEILAAQLRSNPNIVGFKVGGEKIISLHYADDTTITITQNRCFKEVIKELRRYEDATGAKINLLKTQGLWVGGWKHRAAEPNPPLGVKWTTGNVWHLGVFFGTDDPAKHTFDKLLPKVHQSLQYWKSFRLSKLAKARILELFIASKLLYATKFYCMPKPFYTALQKQFTQFINWPRRPTVSEAELHKLRSDGGLKLIHLLTKSQASKCAWLVLLLTFPALALNLQLFSALFGEQLSHKQGVDILFSPYNYAKTKLRFPSPFYKEAVLAFTSQSLQQHVPLDEVPRQLYFYSRIFAVSYTHLTLPTNREV